MEYEQAFIVAGFALVLVRHGGGWCGVVVGWVLGVLRYFPKCDAKKVVQGSEDGVRGAPWQRSSRDLTSRTRSTTRNMGPPCTWDLTVR